MITSRTGHPMPRTGSTITRHLSGVVVRELLFMFLDLSIELVDEDVDGGIHVRLGLLGVDRSAADVNRGFRLVLQLLHCQDAVDVGHVVEVALDLCELGSDVATQGIGDVDVMARNAQLHDSLLPLVIVTCSASAHSMTRSSWLLDTWRPCAGPPLRRLRTAFGRSDCRRGAFRDLPR